ncbi:nucleoside triphosphate pyrophosphohydrolase family protein [Xanthobacter sediminis]|uniref:nucleoside triphosphate pyrophosphohydrolase family protein n=1 Tax=Xanthobacter sediminis TaxID=3119926 RepID=UPI003728187A
MQLAEYQRLALETDRTNLNGADAAQLVPLLGLAGEAGQLLSEYKKRLRDGPSHVRFVDRVREELGDILWYVANVASKYGLELEDVAADNLAKTRARFGDGAGVVLGGSGMETESFPERFTLSFEQQADGDRVIVRTLFDGEQVGAELTDNAHEDDGYRFHDVFHAGFVAVLGWSPVLRKLLGCKRRSSAKVDEVEDGGRAAVIEEGISAVIFDYGRNHNFLKGTGGVDEALLKTVRGMSSHLEVAEQPEALWQSAIIQSFAAWRQIVAAQGGSVEIDRTTRTLRYMGEAPKASATAAAL